MTLELKQVGRAINNQWIVENLTMTVADNECLALVGPSGCGKSTTLRLIAGLDPVSYGSIHISGRNITTLSPAERSVGMVFQSYALLPHLTVFENLELGLRIRGISKRERTSKIKQILELVQLWNRASNRPAELSGGQRQRVALARALLRNPEVYLLDEPMSNLDAQLREDIRPELRRLVLEQSKPTIYVTHDQHEAMAMAQRIAVLHEGKIEQIDTPYNLYHNPCSLFVARFIGRPQINCLNDESNRLRAVRPESIRFSDSGLTGKLQSREWLGNSQLLFLETQRGLIRMMAPPEQVIPEQIKLTWRVEDEILFNPETGCRLNR
ncbi:ABC transporter ATP-binding protein [Synechococcus sp. GEYO]|uniref:ABC transporter ATP-binding protein n=1 Tax=Synechococcus sp. GEYO TaxID=2575511 RepID=UPI000E0E2D66|nr:ABC transporter ATP-binding protein [Synechococcus sp. GEYO]